MLQWFNRVNFTVVLIFNLVSGALANTIFVPQPDPVKEAWRWQVFSELDGLASVRVDAIAQAEGKVWFATDEGVCQYDGLLWQTHTVADGLPSNDVNAVLPLENGEVWVGTTNGVARLRVDAGLSILPGPNEQVAMRWDIYDTSSGLPSMEITDLLVDGDGGIWTATASNGVAVFDGQAWRSFNTSDGLADDHVNDIALGADGTVWFATERGATRFDGVTWHSFRRGDGLPAVSVTSIFADRDGGLWFVQNGVGVTRLTDGHWQFYDLSHGLPDLQVRQVFQTPDGVIWMICRSGLARLGADGHWQAYNRRELPGLGEPLAAGVDDQGAIWIGGRSSQGVVRFHYLHKRLNVFHVGQVVDMSQGGGLGEDRDGNLWVGTGKGALKFDGAMWMRSSEYDGAVSNVFTDKEETLYLMGRDARGPAVLGVNGMSRHLMQNGLDGETVTAMERTLDGALWAGVPGSQSGLFRWDAVDDIWEAMPKRKESLSRILAMSSSRDGSLWMAGRGRGGRDLSRRSSGGMWRGFIVRKRDEVRTLVAGADGSLWMGFGFAGGGVLRLNTEGAAETYTVREGLAHDEVHVLVEDGDGHLWAGTSSGISRYDGQEWVTVRGLPDMDVRALAIARDGALWMRTLSGDVVRYWNDGEAPRTFLEHPQKIVAPDGNVNFAWQGQDLGYSSSAKLAYSYRLDGGPWSPFSDKVGHSWFSLPDGKHKLEVRARDIDLNVQSIPGVHDFEVETPLWKTPWFVALMLALLGTIGLQTWRILARDKALANANIRLQELDRLKTDFFSNVSHELRTPLTSIKGYVDNMLDGIGGDLTERQERYLGRVKTNADRLTRLISELLDLSRLEQGRDEALQLNISKIEMRPTVIEAIDNLRPLAESAGLSLTFSGEDCFAMADRDRVIQMIVNLAGNAIKFTPEGGEVNVSVRSDGTGFIQTAVKDTGRGIPKENLDLIFERFHQVKGTQGGTGIGLPVTKGLVERHGGTIWVESEIDVGSTFTFTLPEAKEK